MVLAFFIGICPTAANASAPTGSGPVAADAVFHALETADAIEIRDVNNQVVSRDAMRREIASGSRQVESQAADLSALRGMRELVKYLERLQYLAPVFRGGEAGSGFPAAVVAAAPPRSPKARVPALMVRMIPIDLLHLLAYSPLQLTTTPGRVRVLPLRL